MLGAVLTCWARQIAKQKIKDATPSGRRGEVEKRETCNNMATSDGMVSAGVGQAERKRASAQSGNVSDTEPFSRLRTSPPLRRTGRLRRSRRGIDFSPHLAAAPCPRRTR